MPIDQKFSIRSTGGLVHDAARDYPDRVAIAVPELGSSFTYGEFAHRIDVALALLQDLGLKRGDRLAYCGRNNDGFYALFYAAIRGGFVMVSLNWRCVASDIAFFLSDSGAKLVFCDAEFNPLVQEALTQIAIRLPVIPTEDSGGGRSLRAMLDAAARNDASEIEEGPDAPPCLLLYTSGTTGRPKGVALSAEAQTEMRRIEFAANFPGGRDEIYLLSAPLFHVGGISMVMIAMARQATCIVTPDSSAANQLALCERYAPTIAWMVPTVVRDFLEAVKARGVKLPSLRSLMYGAAPMPPSLLRDMIETFGCSFSNCYGMTEVSGAATLLPAEDHDPASPVLNSVGRAMPGIDIEIRDENARLLPTGTSGEIWIRTPTLMDGYWNRPDATREAVVDGWYRSGDGGWMDENGYIFLTDRIQDMIVSGGENVYPVEVENVLRLFDGVFEVAVVPTPHERWGEAVTAVIECRPGTTVDPAALVAFARERLAGYKVPRRVYFVSSLPRTGSGKVQRKNSRQLILSSGAKPALERQ